MKDDSSDMYKCPWCLESMLQKDKTRHEIFECRVLIGSRAVDFCDSMPYAQSAKKTYGCNSKVKKVTDQTVKCPYCSQLCSEDRILSHTRTCPMNVYGCPLCTETVLERDRAKHETSECRMIQDHDQSNRSRRSFVSKETQTEDLTDDGAGEDDRRHLGTKGGIIQQKNFKDMLLEGQDHDVTLKVKGREFRAHKNILRARSLVFAAMFTHSMKEADSGDVTIEDCDPNAFGEFLEYVYTGKVDNLTPINALGLYYAGDKYDLPDLKEMSVEFLKTCLLPNVVCDVIDMAMKHDEEDLLDCATTFFTDHLVEIWQTVEWQRFAKSNFTLANELNIKAMKSSHTNI